MPRKSFVSDKTDEEFGRIVKESIFYSEVARKLGYNCTTNHRIIKKRINKLNLDTSHFKNGSYVCNLKKKKKTLKEICIKKGTYNTVSVSVSDPQNRYEDRSVTFFNST